MSRNAESRFALNPTRLDMHRSRFDRPSRHITTANAGDLIPFYLDEVLPGDTFDVKTSKVVRMQTLLAPIFDNIYLDQYYFFVPNRLVWEHWKEFCGENNESAWIPETKYTIPQIEAPSGGWNVGTVADYMGIPTGVDNISVSSLPFRAYAKVCEDWFRKQAVTDPLNIPLTDSTQSGSNGSSYINDVANGGMPFKVSRMVDYFSSALPSPQRGPEVTISAASGGLLPVFAMDQDHDPADLVKDADGKYIGLRGYLTSTGNMVLSNYDDAPINGYLSNGYGDFDRSISYKDGNAIGRFIPSNLFAGSAGEVTVATINQLRQAFQIQKYYEKNARSGGRYIEVIKSHFGVNCPDYRVQRSEYLGGNRIPINISQVVQNSGTPEDGTPQGTTTAYSHTADVHHDFVKSFTEHGYVIGVCCIRYTHTYQDGIERMWSRKTDLDYYWPVFANLGEQAIYNKEIFAQGTDEDNEIFGYQERWAEYRYKPSRVSGEMRSKYTASLDVWHLGDDYSQLPTLSDDWIREDASNIDRVLAVKSDVSAQFLLDFYIVNRTTRVMPMYSIPGLIDHH